MTTTVRGTIYFSPDYPGQERKPTPYDVAIDGDRSRKNGFDTHRSVYLDGSVACLSVYNTDADGVLVLPDGKRADKITFQKEGKDWTPTRRYVKEGFPITATVEGLGSVEITWFPKTKEG